MAALVAAFSGMGRDDQRATAGRLMSGSSLIWLMVSSVMYLARWTAHSSFCSMRIAPTRRRMASSLGKMPTTSVRRIGALLLEQNDQWAVQRTRYMTLETIAPLSDNPIVMLPAMAR